MSYTLQVLADRLNAKLHGDGSVSVTRLVHPEDWRQPQDLVLAMDPKLVPLLHDRPVTAAILSEATPPDAKIAPNLLIVSRPRLALAHLTAMFAPGPTYGSGIHPSAAIDPTASLAQDAVVGPFCVIGAGVVLGQAVVLQGQVTVEAGAHIGDQTVLRSGVRIGAGVTIGARCLIHFNTSIGADGFSFVTPEIGSVESAKAQGAVTATNHQGLVRIASLGSVMIGDDVEIGANTSIDRGTIRNTRIGRGTKIDNQVQIGHNVVIGEDVMICGRVGIAGSAFIGNRAVLGGSVGIADHARIGEDAVLMAMAGVSGNIPPRSVYGGIPAVPRDRWIASHMALSRLKFFQQKFAALVESVKALEEKAKRD
jgi:UDP-3-O-[3-hydroxymyristoyl] glucosamine N-acyltransferase